jgi:truncated hemoglobin YjbI
MFEFAGGDPAFLALAAAHHERCLQDPELNHPFSYAVDPQHIEHLAAYWAEVFGGPARYSDSLGGHARMLAIHAGQGPATASAIASLRASCRRLTTHGFLTTRSSGLPCAATCSGLCER